MEPEGEGERGEVSIPLSAIMGEVHFTQNYKVLSFGLLTLYKKTNISQDTQNPF